MPVCIAGMHRSGTSMVARLLHLSGVWLGSEEELLPAAPDNLEGFWEHRGFLNVNEALLACFEGGWDAPPVLAPGWERRPELAPLRAHVQQLVERFAAHPAWGWKDPRSSITLPFWKQLVPDLKVVVCLRHPLEVADSLTRRNHTSLAFALRLWRFYNERVMAETTPADRVVSHYEAYFHDARRELRRVLAALGVAAPDEALDRAASVASPLLQRSRKSAGDWPPAELAAAARALYEEMCREAGPVFAAAIEGGLAEERGAPAVAPAAADPAAASYRPAHHIVQLQQELAERAQEVKALSTLAEERQRVILARDEDVASLKQAVAERDARVEALAAELEPTRAELAAARAELADITGSRGWRLVLALRRVRRFLGGR